MWIISHTRAYGYSDQETVNFVTLQLTFDHTQASILPQLFGQVTGVEKAKQGLSGCVTVGISVCWIASSTNVSTFGSSRFPFTA